MQTKSSHLKSLQIKKLLMKVCFGKNSKNSHKPPHHKILHQGMILLKLNIGKNQSLNKSKYETPKNHTHKKIKIEQPMQINTFKASHCPNSAAYLEESLAFCSASCTHSFHRNYKSRHNS
jgi:hypothetical protein